MKVNKSFIINTLKRSYLLSNSPTSRTDFNVEISTVQSHTCSDFAKNEHRVLCKHILFIVIHVLNGNDLEPSLRICFIEENVLRSLFDAAGKDIKHQFLREQPTGKRKDFHAILVEHACFTQPQIWKVQKKCKWLAKCTNSRCRKVINVGTECIVIEGALMVPFNTNKAVAQKFYYCLHVLCVTNWLPWTNIRPLLELTFDNDITDDRKKEIFSLLNI